MSIRTRTKRPEKSLVNQALILFYLFYEKTNGSGILCFLCRTRDAQPVQNSTQQFFTPHTHISSFFVEHRTSINFFIFYLYKNIILVLENKAFSANMNTNFRSISKVKKIEQTRTLEHATKRLLYLHT